MDGTHALSMSAAGSFNPGPSWQVKGSGDFNGDGRADILWQGSDGTPRLADGRHARLIGGCRGLLQSRADWQIKGSGDFNGDGRADILWQDTMARPRSG